MTHSEGEWRFKPADGFFRPRIFAGIHPIAIFKHLGIAADGALMAAAPCLLRELEQAQADVCSLHCPSVRRDDEPWTHSDRCKSIQAALKKARGEMAAAK